MRRTWTTAAVAVVALLAAYLLTTEEVWRQSAWLALVAGSTGAVVVGLRVHPPPARRPWVLLAGALSLLTVVNLLEFPLWQASDLLLATASGLELLAFPIIGLATLDLVRRQTPNGDREGVIDGTIVMVALATLLSATVTAPALVQHASVLSYVLLAVAPIVLAGVATAAMRLLFVGNQRVVSMWLVAAAPLLALGGHILRTLTQSAGTYARGGWEDLPIGLAYGLVGLAALHPSMTALTEPAPRRPHTLTHGRVAILGMALLAAPATMVMTGRSVMPLLAAVVLSLLVLLRLWRLVIERETGRDDMHQQAAHDPLTGLPNRSSLLARLDDVLSRRSSSDPPDAVLFLDLDGFKRVNDDRGHAAGDHLLTAVAARLQAASRQGDLLARLAGDEFVLVCERIGESAAVALAERLIAVLEPLFVLPGGPATIGVSIGVTVHAAGDTHAEALLAEADAAMYQAKQRGGSAYEVYGTALGERLRRRRRLEVDLSEALHTDELHLVYQPIVSLDATQSRRTVGYEALLRWDHPDLGPISPIETVSAAEATGAIGPLGAWVLRRACRQLARWNAARPRHDPLTMYVNVSARELLDVHMPARVAAVLADTGVGAAHVVLEVTEHAALDESGEGLRTLHALRLLGLRIALDDFGTGYSSLTHLKQVPFDFIKVDSSFMGNLDVEVGNRAIVEAVIGIARRLGAQVVGEGIENAAQLDALRRLGCPLGQGWLLGRPCPVSVIDEAHLRVPG